MASRRSLFAAFLVLTFGATKVMAADDFPQRPIKLVVAFAPGGPTDVLARVVAVGMSKALGQQVFVDNKAGAGGAIGTDAVAHAPADGYTLLFSGDGALTVLPQMQKSVRYDPEKDLAPIRLAVSQVNVLVANAADKFNNVNDVLAAAKKDPGKLTFGSAGNGTPSHLVGALLESNAGVDLTHVPYKGAGPATIDLLGGRLDIMFVGMPVALQNASRKETTILAVTGDKRAPALPNVPTFAESGVKGLGDDVLVWWAVMAPAGVPQSVQAKLSAAVHAALTAPESRKAFALQGVDVLDQSGATVSKWISRDHARWAELIKSKKVSVQ